MLREGGDGLMSKETWEVELRKKFPHGVKTPQQVPKED
jgi:hypothetical protein